MSKTWKTKGRRDWDDYEDIGDNNRRMIEENKQRRDLAKHSREVAPPEDLEEPIRNRTFTSNRSPDRTKY